MLSDDWEDWQQCTDENLYVRLGLDPEKADFYTINQIESAIKEIKEWWIRKPRSNPIWAERIRLAEVALAEARAILCNPKKKKEYDEKLKKELLRKEKEEREKNIKTFVDIIIIPVIERDKTLTPEEEENIINAGKRLGFSDTECRSILDDTLKKFGAKRVSPSEVTIANALDLFRTAVCAAIVDGKLESEEKRYLLMETARKLGLNEEDARKVIIDCLREEGAKEGSPQKFDLPEELQGKNYYEIFGISEKASSREIEDAYKNQFNIWNARASNPKYTPYVRAVKDFLLEARNTLLDPVRRREYDESLK